VGSYSQRFALVKQEGKVVAIPSPRFSATWFELEGNRLFVVLADLHWIAEGQLLAMELAGEGRAITRVLKTSRVVITDMHMYGRVELTVVVAVEKQATHFVFPETKAIAPTFGLDVVSVFCTAQSGNWPKEEDSRLAIDLHYLEEQGEIELESLSVGAMGQKTRYRILQNTPIIALREGNFRGKYPFYKFAQVKRMILLERK
jgi:hypothetical protein